MDTPTERDPQVQDWLLEVAEDFAREEHDELTSARPEAWGTNWRYERELFDERHEYADDFDDFFAMHRNHFIEQAREWLAAQVAA